MSRADHPLRTKWTARRLAALYYKRLPNSFHGVARRKTLWRMYRLHGDSWRDITFG